MKGPESYADEELRFKTDDFSAVFAEIVDMAGGNSQNLESFVQEMLTKVDGTDKLQTYLTGTLEVAEATNLTSNSETSEEGLNVKGLLLAKRLGELEVKALALLQELT